MFELIKGTSAEGISANKTSFEAAGLIVAGELGAGGCFASALEAHEHDDIWLTLPGFERFGMWVNELDELVKHCFLNKSFFIHRWGYVFEINGSFNGFAERANKFDIDVCLEKGGADFFDHAIKGLLRRLTS